ncbi:hypothetical protein [Streptomyces sp. NPDC127100]|uniref:hypothetical protein n=1 Tax=Streptomyces sp. NPDC127100 TaxID=3347138 RepID=UPI003658A611
MADEQDGWLDRETAEILLRGESLKAVDPAALERAERLAETLDALAAHPAPTSGELPGEAAALAAFRKARADRAGEWADAPAALGHDAPVRHSDAGLVRIGARRDGVRRSRWARPLRFGLAAALTAGMVGGVAVAAGTGVLPTPFGGAEPDPAASVSAATPPDRPLGPPAPLDGPRGGSTPDGVTPGPSGSGTTRDEEAGEAGPGTRDQGTGGAGVRRRELAASCREVGAGRTLDGARRRALTEAAGGTSRVDAYCRSVLAGTDAATRGRTGDGAGEAAEGLVGGTAGNGTPGKSTGGKGKGNGNGNGNGKQGDNGGKGDQDDQGDQDGQAGNGDKGGGQGEDSGDEDDDGPGRGAGNPHAQGPAALRPAHATGAPAAFVPLPDRRPKYAQQESPGLGNIA